MSTDTAPSGIADTPIFKHRTLRAKIFDLVSEYGAHEILERLADIGYEQVRIHDDCPKWSEVVTLLEKAQRIVETAAPVV